MVTRSSLRLAGALAASAALLLTACGGGGSDGSDRIQPSNSTTATATASATASPTQSATGTGPGAPTFSLPPDVKVVITGFDTGDAATKAVLRDVSYAITALLEAEAKGDGTTPNFKRYFTGLRGAQLSDVIIAYRKSGLTITGTVRDYRPTVKFDAADRAQVTYCEDQRHAYGKVIATGQVKTTKPSMRDFSLWRMGLAKGTSGDWRVVDYAQNKGVAACAVS